MKKTIAILLCLVMALGCAAAEAAEKTNLGVVNLNGKYELHCVMPEGFTMENIHMENGCYTANITSNDPARPFLVLSIGFDEMLSQVKRLNDLDSETLAMIESTFTAEYSVDISYTETAEGTKLMVVKEKNGEFADVYTVFQGYEIEFVLIPSEAGVESLSDEQIQVVIDFLSNLDFVAVE